MLKQFLKYKKGLNTESLDSIFSGLTAEEFVDLLPWATLSEFWILCKQNPKHALALAPGMGPELKLCSKEDVTRLLEEKIMKQSFYKVYDQRMNLVAVCDKTDLEFYITNIMFATVIMCDYCNR